MTTWRELSLEYVGGRDWRVVGVVGRWWAWLEGGG